MTTVQKTVVKKKKKRRLRWGRIFLALFLCVVLLVGIGATVAYQVINYKLEHGKNTYIAILGTDERKNQKGEQRSDSLMLVSVNFNTSAVNILSLPRDSLVDIPCGDLGDYHYDGTDKITHAYHYGGRACTLRTLQNLFELDNIDKYVQVNFDSMIMMVDDIGGITLTASKSFSEWNVGKTEKYSFVKGETYEMDGAMALAYARHRKSDSDVYRAQRQQEVIMAMVKKAKSLDFFSVFTLGKKVLGEVKTNIGIFEALTYYKLATREEFTISKDHAKGSDYTYNGVYYYKLKDSWLEQEIKALKGTLE